MSKREKLEEDYQKYNNDIECLAKEEIERIQEKISLIKKQAERVGEKAEISLEKSNAREAEKKG